MQVYSLTSIPLFCYGPRYLRSYFKYTFFYFRKNNIVLFFVYLLGLAYLLLYLIGFSNDLFSPFLFIVNEYSVFFTIFDIFAKIYVIVLSAQYYTLFICHSAYFSSNSLCFLSIISSILAIYCPTSLTYSHLSMRCVPSGFGTGQTRLVLASGSACHDGLFFLQNYTISCATIYYAILSL